MHINTRECYIEIGTSFENGVLKNSLSLPVPIELPSSNEFMVDAGRNVDGTMLIEQVGRTQYTTQIKWSRLTNKKWWQINRWFDEYGYVFYMRYFSHTEGRVKVHRFYRGNIEKGVPSNTTETLNGYTVPTHYQNCGFSIIDIGDFNVIIEEEMAVD
jgi:hypothetical protein